MPAAAAGVRGQSTVREEYARSETSFRDDPEWQSSPFYRLVHGGNDTELRRRLDLDYRRGEFPLLDRFQDEGSTDYLAMAVRFGRHAQAEVHGMLCSFQTDRPGGFTDPELELLRRLARLALAFTISSVADRTADR